MKKIILLTAVISLVLTGCISSRSSLNDGLDISSVQNQRVEEQKGSFSLLLPEGFEIALIDENSAGGRLSGVKETDKTTEESVLLIEETDIAIDEIIAELLATGSVKEKSRETIRIDGSEALHLSAIFTQSGKSTDYFFIRPQNRTYIFSLPAETTWGYYESVVKTFEHGQDTRGAANGSTETIPEISLDDIDIN